MNTTITDATSTPEELKARWDELLEANPKLRIRNAAEELGVSEAELLATQCGETVTRLSVTDWEAFMQSWKSLGRVMVLTRNDNCVHEKTGVYEQIHPLMHGGKVGLTTGKDIDLRLFMGGWKHAFAVEDLSIPGGHSRSLQIFDPTGTAIHKIYVKSDEGIEPFHKLVEQYRAEDQSKALSVEAPEAKRPEMPDAQIDKDALLDGWKNLKDTHDFFPLLMKTRVAREQALRLADGVFTRKVDNSAARKVLDLASERGTSIMVFVGNDHCIQIHTGPVKKVMEYQDWYNVMDPSFNLHLKESGIASCWHVRKPTADGEVNSLEVFDKDGEVIVQFFGERKPGSPELEAWRELLSDIS
ncbi:MAG: ChuX/HutX family heme-like substrate-binding protein [Verrucomicrobiota bacterium JB024]|nr:ChuX/HutX family heme-like substrate-binding protein [Verrucomicrobiota bacterium JB024]